MKIPPEAKQVRTALLVQNIKEWFCPDCGCKGNEETIDFIPKNRMLFDLGESELVTYCCASCFEENIYITTNDD